MAAFYQSLGKVVGFPAKRGEASQILQIFHYSVIQLLLSYYHYIIPVQIAEL